jgi:manganese/iron transport system substrate-binding protein
VVCEFGDPSGDDAHFHTSPTATAKALVALTPCIADAASDLGIKKTTRFADSALVHEAALTELAAEVKETLTPIPGPDRLLVTSHNSFSTFASENSLQVLGTMLGTGGDSHGHDGANPAVITHLAEEINETGLAVVFVSPGDPDDVADLLLSEVNHEVEVMTLLADSFDTESTGVEDHMSLIRFNAEQILKGLHPEAAQAEETGPTETGSTEGGNAP